MSQSTLKITMTLRSDAIFGSGFSSPGGADIGVCRDRDGYPYLKGTTLKGLLRESLVNYLDWTDGDTEEATVLLGSEGWNGANHERRIHLTDLTLDPKPDTPDECYATRCFTSLNENGVVAQGTLRMAECVVSGMTFTGYIYCDEHDGELLQKAISGIKWLGTMRSRGFGWVGLKAEQLAWKHSVKALLPCRYIRYHLRTCLPLIITDLSRSRDNSYETCGYIPGSSIRGMVLSSLSQKDPEWFNKNKVQLLAEDTCFLNAIPVAEGKTALPAIKGFYEDKNTGDFRGSAVLGSGLSSDAMKGAKRAAVGSFCAPEGEVLHFWRAETGSATRILRSVSPEKETKLFQTRYLSAGQDFVGYIRLTEEAFAPKIASAFEDHIWLGADRYEGFGLCQVMELEAVKQPDWQRVYGYTAQEQIGTILYMLALSPLAMWKEDGTLTGLDTTLLAQKLGVGQVRVCRSSTSVSEYDSYNRTWQCRTPLLRMYDSGSLFQLSCDSIPNLENIQSLQETGLGLRGAEGFGQVLFLREEVLSHITRKQEQKLGNDSASAQERKKVAPLRRARLRWVQDHAPEIRDCKLSRSQIGTIQALCEKAIAQDGTTGELNAFFTRNQQERGAKHADRFTTVEKLVSQTLETPLSETVGADCEDSIIERLKLLCLLFNYSRKGVKEEVD